MNNFKIGDRVRIKGETDRYFNKIGTVVRTGESSFKEPICLVSISDYDCKIWFTEKYLMKVEERKMENKFKVGEKVRVKKNLRSIPNYTGGLVEKMVKQEGEIVTIRRVPSSKGKGYGIEGDIFIWDERAFEKVSEYVLDDVNITVIGTTVIAIDRRTNKRGIARCCPEDTFDYITGVTLALNRLREKLELYNGKIVCIKSGNSFTKGRIYEVINGILKDDDGDNRPWDKTVHTIEEINEIFGRFGSTEFIEVVE